MVKNTRESSASRIGEWSLGFTESPVRKLIVRREAPGRDIYLEIDLPQPATEASGQPIDLRRILAAAVADLQAAAKSELTRLLNLKVRS